MLPIFYGGERGILQLDRFLSSFAFIFSCSPIADGLCLGPAIPRLSSFGFGRLGPQNPRGFKSLFQHKNRQHTVVLSIFMAKRGGFEPPHGSYPPAGIRSQSLQPLGYLSTNDILKTNDRQGSKASTRN